MSDFSKYNDELSLLTNIASTLTDYSEPALIVSQLGKIFSNLINSASVEIYVFDENSKTLRDFSKRWIVIDEFHKNATVDNLYFSLAEFSRFDFFINKKPFNISGISSVSSQKLNDKTNYILCPLKKANKPFGIIKLLFGENISHILTEEFFSMLAVASSLISLKVQNIILAEQMQVNVDFHESMKNIAKIIETQYELNYIIPLIGEMVDRFISDHLIYIFLKSENKDKFELVWPRECRNQKIVSAVSKINTKSKSFVIEDGRVGIFPLVGEKSILGCVVAHSNVDKLTQKEIEYIEQLTQQSSITIHRANVYAEVLQHATLDALTSLNNRRQFEIRLKQEVATARRQRKPLCAIMLDIDFFKSVNDTYGHVVGDEVLRTISAVIKRELREYDIASRYGGEEFAILLPFTKIEEAYAVGQRLRSAVELTNIAIAKEGSDCVTNIKVTVSIGVHEYESGETPQELYEKADKALYEAKTHGRNKVVIFK